MLSLLTFLLPVALFAATLPGGAEAGRGAIETTTLVEVTTQRQLQPCLKKCRSQKQGACVRSCNKKKKISKRKKKKCRSGCATPSKAVLKACRKSCRKKATALKHDALDIDVDAQLLDTATAATTGGEEGANVDGPWPECIGMVGEDCEKVIEENASDVIGNVFLLPVGSLVTLDYRTDRVRIWLDGDGKVESAPERG